MLNGAGRLRIDSLRSLAGGGAGQSTDAPAARQSISISICTAIQPLSLYIRNYDQVRGYAITFAMVLSPDEARVMSHVTGPLSSRRAPRDRTGSLAAHCYSEPVQVHVRSTFYLRYGN